MNETFPLSLVGLVKGFDGSKVLDGVSFDLKPGSITGLLGRNAAGKTTLIRTAIGSVSYTHLTLPTTPYV